MSAKDPSTLKSLSVADRLERKLSKIKAAERKKFLNENFVRLEKTGDLSYEAVRTYRTGREGEAPAELHMPEAQTTGTAANRWSPAADEPRLSENNPPAEPSEIQANPNLLPNK